MFGISYCFVLLVIFSAQLDEKKCRRELEVSFIFVTEFFTQPVRHSLIVWTDAYLYRCIFLHFFVFFVFVLHEIGNFNKACRFQDPQDVVESPRRK